MTFASVLSIFALAAAPAFAADPALLQMAPGGAKALAGLQISQSKQSPLGRYLLSRLATPAPRAQSWMTQAGFDPRRDLTEVLVAATGSDTAVTGGLVLARGTFDTARIGAAIEANGGTHTSVGGVDVYNAGTGAKAWSVAFPDTTTGVMGSPADVAAALAQRASAAATATALAGQVTQLSAANDFWFLTLAPISEFASAMPDPSAAGAMQNGTLFQAVMQASGGLRFGDSVVLTADAVTRSDKDAQSLEDVVRFLASMIQSNAQANPLSQQLAAILSALTLSTSANVMHLSLSVPEAQMEAFLAATASQRRAAPPLPPHRQPPAP